MRNIAARCPELRSDILDAGAESVLRACGQLSDCAPEAYAALRDLGCDVQYVKVLEDGRVVSAYEQFGEAKRLQFNPIYDDTEDIVTRVQDNAEAPFKGQGQQQQGHQPEENKMVNFDHDHTHIHSLECDHS
jgi:hypothetical protein